MSYDDAELSVAGGRPFFLYQFVQGEAIWRFTARAEDWVDPEAAVWEAAAIGHGDVVQGATLEKAGLEVSFPRSHGFARRFVAPPAVVPVTLTIFRGHEAVPDETVAHWKGRVVSGALEGAQIMLTCEPVFTTLRRTGVRATYQRLCRHVLYRGGCRLDIADWVTLAEVGAVAGLVVTVPDAAGQPDGWFSGGVLRFGADHGFILRHAGAGLTLSSPMASLAAAVTAAVDPVTVGLAPGCDLRAGTCAARFDNLLNFGGFPEIPGRNPFGGGSIV